MPIAVPLDFKVTINIQAVIWTERRFINTETGPSMAPFLLISLTRINHFSTWSLPTAPFAPAVSR